MNAWLAQHQAALRWAMQRLWASPINTLLALLAIGVVLALPASGQMLLGNVLQLVRAANTTETATTPQISLFMKLDSERKEVDALGGKLRAQAAVRSVRFVSREETLKRMQADPGLREIIAALPQNPYPDAFIITPKNDTPESMEWLRDDLRRWPGVEQVQLDAAWVRRLDAMLRLGRLGIGVLAVLLGIGLIAITFTTLRLQILTRRAEIDVCRLLGATDAYIRRPFHYFGFLQGLAGGLVAWLIVLALTLLLREPVARLAALYDTPLWLQPLPLPESLLLLTLAAGLGWLGAALSLGRHLRDGTT
ncbi:MAG: permease-like cell division protein FtsX [Sterolibacterium sp.]|jgi:cell division transport system permease protein|nr:permease-like cell division protein FtsX [Sterolibacterium sp.]